MVKTVLIGPLKTPTLNKEAISKKTAAIHLSFKLQFGSLLPQEYEGISNNSRGYSVNTSYYRNSSTPVTVGIPQ
jgi:hypothetical protein